ncbi:TPA: Dot/Icm T4SS effector sphingosine 1-phosphate lyase LegS2 [Legionella pneumophila]|nr:Dot/Icm T4SS effector sphingosine 1-phosphate lyase LegS2 [Legionella pneumophila]HEM6947699.1 Dot/Icm T4SS effector sphingosine 1-phosphate lyase LegS2 [Legionella pneumophila]HEM7106127.1 Dot/Icm T4SS effector sphingosine 1-phosphate lyase LegS2 [Legionella pneumophila]HEO1347131.1 Dot/Icm T4SS effector sphingosine 1-phosphate lyase LegS2 [Legionella pneumophila]
MFVRICAMFGFISDLLTAAVSSLDELLQDTPAHQIILGTAALYFLYNQYHNPSISRWYRSRNNASMKQRIIDSAYALAKNLPGVNQIIEKELNKELSSTREKLRIQRSGMTLREEIPEEGLSPQDILSAFDVDVEKCHFDFLSVTNDSPEREFLVGRGDGKDSGALYAIHPKELTELLKEVYGATALTNPLHDKWPRINAMQAEVIRWCQNLFHGSKEGYGLLTHGGTTSIIEAMAAYVIRARAKGIDYPEIVVPETAHAAFKKAAELTGAILITVPVDKKTGAVNPNVMSSYITRNTAVMVGSAPSFMNGIHDPVSELGQLAKKKNVPFHVDACLGGFLTAFLDTSSEPMDFRVPGVTSISADLHKYGCCPKGTSVCLFSEDSPALSVYAALNWSGGLYATPGILDGSTSGARVAEVYATLSYYGKNKYQEIAKSIITLRNAIQKELTTLVEEGAGLTSEDIYVYGNPQWSILGFRSNTCNAHFIADELEKRGWKLNLLQNPDGFHLCLTHVHTVVKGFETQFINDLREAVIDVKNYPPGKKPSGNVKVYGAVGMMPIELQKEICKQYQKARLDFTAANHGSLGIFTPSSTEEDDGLRNRKVGEQKVQTSL